MARGIFPYEVTDQDFQWLIKNYCDSHAPVAVIDSGCLPLVMVILDENARALIPQEIVSHNILGAIADSNDDVAGGDDPKKGG